jgi:hypothetical protein
MNPKETSADAWSDIVDRAAVHGVRYLIGGSDWGGSASKYSVPDDAPLAPLLLDLARAKEARLRDAIVALILRHPEYTSTAESTARSLPADDPVSRMLLVSILVAAALQNEWSFVLGLYRPDQTEIEADHLAKELRLPLPHTDFGRPCLIAAADLLRERDLFPFNYEAGWNDTVHLLHAQLVQESRNIGA